MARAIRCAHLSSSPAAWLPGSAAVEPPAAAAASASAGHSGPAAPTAVAAPCASCWFGHHPGTEAGAGAPGGCCAALAACAAAALRACSTAYAGYAGTARANGYLDTTPFVWAGSSQAHACAPHPHPRHTHTRALTCVHTTSHSPPLLLPLQPRPVHRGARAGRRQRDELLAIQRLPVLPYRRPGARQQEGGVGVPAVGLVAPALKAPVAAGRQLRGGAGRGPWSGRSEAEASATRLLSKQVGVLRCTLSSASPLPLLPASFPASLPRPAPHLAARLAVLPRPADAAADAEPAA